MNGLKLSTKLIGGFLVMGLLLIAGGSLGPLGISHLAANLREVTEVQLPASNSLGMLIASQKNIYKIQESLLIPEKFSDKSAKTQLIQQLVNSWRESDKNCQLFEFLPKSDEGKTLWQNFMPIYESWRKNHSTIIQFIKMGKRDEALTLAAGKAGDAFHQTSKMLHELSQLNLKLSQESKKRGEALAYRQIILVVTGTMGGIVLALVFGLYFARSVARPIQRIIHNLSETYFQLASTSDQIALVSHQLAAGTSTQAAAMEEAVSATAELSANIKENTKHIEDMRDLTDESHKVGMGAFEFFIQAKKATKEIKLSSEQASKIIKSIGEIAFQTNLLALTASIEAVQSTHDGIGFSVVAKEVRNLATRSTEAVEKTSSLIEENVKFITKGDDLVRASLGSFITYGESSNPINSYTATASEAAQKQVRGIEQINTALDEITQTAQINAASAQESASVIQEINAQINDMAGIVRELKAIAGLRISKEIA